MFVFVLRARAHLHWAVHLWTDLSFIFSDSLHSMRHFGFGQLFPFRGAFENRFGVEPRVPLHSRRASPIPPGWEVRLTGLG